ncbi:MAG: MEKHLA domain-containing protein, partial [Chloroflexi bacterium]|nr:MEKHLA domain-containing protein [Chloroflexota bacterium]
MKIQKVQVASVSILEGPERVKQADYIRQAIIASTAIAIVTGLLLVPQDGELSFRIVLPLITLAVNATAYGLLKRDRLRQAAGLIVIGYWIITTLLISITGGIHSPWLSTQMVIIVFAGLTAGTVGGATVGGLSLVADVGIHVLDSMGLISLNPYSAPMEESVIALIIGFGFSISLIVVARRLARDSLDRPRRDERLYRALFEKTNDAVLIIDLNHTYLDVNQQAAELLGYTIGELVGMPVKHVIVPEERKSSEMQVERVNQENVLPVYERTVVCKDGSRKTVEVNLALISDQDGHPLHYQSIVRDVSERKRLEQELKDSLAEMEQIAMRDILTGTLNRRAITDYADSEWHRSHRENRPMCLMLIDVDNLKAINDERGHLMGDKALTKLVDAINASKRRYDWTGRWGGDEFLMVLPATNLTEAEEVAERLRRLVQDAENKVDEIE